MKCITKFIIAMVIISSVVFLAGCVDVETSTSSPPTLSTDDKQDQVTPLVDKTNPKDSSSSNDTTYLDDDLKIDYPRPTGYPVLKKPEAPGQRSVGSKQLLTKQCTQQ